MGISLNKQKLMYNILTPSIIAIYKFLRTYGGSGHIYICPWLAKGSVITEMEGLAPERFGELADFFQRETEIGIGFS